MIGLLSPSPRRASGRLLETLSATTLWVALASLLGPTPSAHAICDVIPGPTNQFRAAVGAADRPFAGPGEFVDVKIRPQVCDKTSLGLKDVSTPSGVGAEDVAVTVIFTPPNNAPRHAVVTATDCARFASSVCVGGLSAGSLCTNDLQCLGGSCTGPSKLSTCQAQLGVGGAASCVTATGPDLAVATSANEGHVRFRFPDTDALVGTASDDRTLAGPATIAVSPPTAALPCGLASQRCAVAGGTIACVDELYAIDGTCSTQTAALDETFQHFTALPPPNNYEAVCDTPGTPCDGTATEVRFTTDASGNVLIPMDYRGVLVRLDDVPVPRLVRGETNVDAFTGPPLTPVAIPDAPNFLASYSPQGRKVPPLFTPLADPNAPASLTLFGSIDAPLGVIRIARKGPGTLTCSGGANAGNACTSDAQCPAADCALFEFRDRYDVGVGPVVLPDTLYAVGAENPVPIDGLNETTSLFAFVRSEAIQNQDLNGDGDQSDFVATLRDRSTGTAEAIGAAGAEGRAVVKLRSAPFAFPAVATEGDVLAFLEPETGRAQDLNGNGTVFDSILRVFRRGTSSASQLTAENGAPTGDGILQVSGSAVALSNGRLYFETREAALVPVGTELISRSLAGFPANDYSGVPSISADGKVVAFRSKATNLVNDSLTQGFLGEVFARDRASGITQRVSTPANIFGSAQPAISGDGRFVAFYHVTGPLLTDILVRDRQAGTTSTVAAAAALNQASLSEDGRFIAYTTPTGSINGKDQVFVRDLQNGTSQRVSPRPTNSQSVEECSAPSISMDGRFVVFVRREETPPPLPTVVPTVYLYDRTWATLETVAVNAGAPSISSDGRFVAFEGGTPDLVPGDTNGRSDVFVRDRLTGTTERVNLDSSGAQAAAGGGSPTISRDGRFVAFTSSDLVLGDPSGIAEVYVHDRQTGATEHVSVAPDGTPANTATFTASISGDGRFVAFDSQASNLTNGQSDVFVHGPLGYSAAADLTSDGDNSDRVLRFADTAQSPPLAPSTLCPIGGTVAVAAGRAAFLRDESASPTSATCGNNGDADASDLVVHLAEGAVVSNLRCAAMQVGLSSTRVAALVSEQGQGADLDGDGLLDSDVLHVRAVASGAPGSCAAGWTNTGLRGSRFDLVGERIALLTPETYSAGEVDLNGDGDVDDTVLRVVDAGTGALVPLVDEQGGPLAPPAADDFVLGESILAFRSSELAAGVTDLNADGDTLDSVLRVVDLVSGQILGTGQAAVPCTLEACDPRRPYRVDGSSVTYLTLEAQQGAQDLNGDGDASDLLLQVFNARNAVATFRNRSLAAVSAGVCTTTKLACASDDECAGGVCFVPPGQCDLELGTSCDPSILGVCGANRYCRASSPTTGICHEAQGNCQANADCTGAAICTDANQQIQRLAAPLADAVRDALEPGAQVLASAGTCTEVLASACTTSADCAGGAFCDAGACVRQHGGCTTTGDCPAGACTRSDLLTTTAADQDGDGLADPIDNCPSYPNVNQSDLDEDGIGDVCDAQTCGNGIREGNPATESGVEECDDGDRIADAICDANCQLVANDCADGFDNDGDGKIDYGTAGANDPGCQNELAFASESPQCDDGRDNDGDGIVDWPAETKCQNRFDDDELTDPAVGCGLLGIEPLGLAALVAVLRRRAWRSTPRTRG